MVESLSTLADYCASVLEVAQAIDHQTEALKQQTAVLARLVVTLEHRP